MPTLEAVLDRDPAPRVPRRRAEGGPGARRVRGARRRPRTGPRASGRLVVRAGRPCERIGGLAPLWPRWLNADRRVGRDDRDGGRARLSRDLGRVARPRRAALARARAADLEVAAWTVRRRPTFDRLERLGVSAICVEAAALDGVRPGSDRGRATRGLGRAAERRILGRMS